MINTCHATIRKNPNPSLQKWQMLSSTLPNLWQTNLYKYQYTYIHTHLYKCMYVYKALFLVIRFHHRMQIWHTINAKYIFYPQCLHVKHIDVKKFTLND